MRLLSMALIVCLTSCSGSVSSISKQLGGSDSLVINFNTPQTSNIKKTVTTTEKTAIKKLAAYGDSKTGNTYKLTFKHN